MKIFISFFKYFLLVTLFLGCASESQYTINVNPTKNNLIKSSGKITEVIIPIVDSANVSLTIEYPDLDELFTDDKTLYFATFKDNGFSQSVYNLYDIFNKNKIVVPYSKSVRSFKDMQRVKNLKSIKLIRDKKNLISYQNIKEFNIFVKIFYMRGIGHVKIQYTKDYTQDPLAKQYIKKEKVKENIKISTEKMAKYMIPSCKKPKWDGDTKDGIPVGKGCFTCANYIGIFAHDYYRVCGEVEDGIIKEGTVHSDVTDGTIFGYRTTIYHEDFSDPTQIKDLMIKLHNKAAKEWNEHQEESRYTSSKSSSNSSKCDRYKSKCMSYCDKKSTKPTSLFSLGARSDCNIGCKLAYDDCKSGNESAWKVGTCHAICRGVSHKDHSWLPFSSSSFDRCVDDCLADFF